MSESTSSARGGVSCLLLMLGYLRLSELVGSFVSAALVPCDLPTVVVETPALLLWKERAKRSRRKAVAGERYEAKFLAHLQLEAVVSVGEVSVGRYLLVGALCGVGLVRLLSVARTTAEAWAEEKSTSEALRDKLACGHDDIEYIGV